MMPTTILLADDDILVQKMVRAVVEHHGYACETVSDGAQCLARLAKVPAPALVLLDLGMPVMDGLHVLASLKHLVPDERFPIAVFSGQKQQETVRRALELGADDFIVKPFAPGELTRRIKDLVFVADTGAVAALLSNLHIPDVPLAAAIARHGPAWANRDVYPLSDAHGSLCIVLPAARSPLALAKAPAATLLAEVAVFRPGPRGWRKVWPRFAAPGRVLKG